MDTPDLLGLTVSMAATTLLVAAVAGLLPRIVGDEPNPVVGIRTKATMSSPAAWQVAHNAARPYLVRTVWSAVVGLVVQASIGVAAGFGSVASAAVAVAVFVAVFVVLIYAALKGNAAAKDIAALSP